MDSLICLNFIVPKKTINLACSATLECQTSLLLQCLSNICSCPNGYYWDTSGAGCRIKISLSFLFYSSYNNTVLLVVQKNYAVSCTSTSQCKTSLNLVCSTNTSQCICPTNLGLGYCDCFPNQYYSGSVSGCLSRVTYNQGCSNTYECISGLGLSCTTSKCLCSSTQYWDNQKCSKLYSIN